MADWSDPLARRLAAVALTAGDVGPSARRLGAARAHAGVGVDEGLDDLDRLRGDAYRARAPRTL